MSRSSYFSSLLPPTPVSPNVLRLRWKCAISTCTSSTLSSLHVNKHPECITGSVLNVHAVRRAADGLVTAAKAHQSGTSESLPQLLSSTTPTLHPLEAMWHSWTVTNHLTPPLACFAVCCLVILPWQSPRLSQLLP